MPLVSAGVFFPGQVDATAPVDSFWLAKYRGCAETYMPGWQKVQIAPGPPTKSTTRFAIDAAGNYYGGGDANLGSGGFGDIVKDPNGAYGIVQKVFKKDDGNYYILVQLYPTVSNPAGLAIFNEPASSGVGAYSFDPPASVGVTPSIPDSGAILGGRSLSGVLSSPQVSQGTPIEVECLARQCTVISHLDGSLLQASGSGAATLIGNTPPTNRNYFMG